MTWSLRFQLRERLRGSLWVVPIAGGAAGFLIGPATIWLGTVVSVPARWDYSAGTASTVLAAIVGAMIGLTGFVVTISVLVVQMATGTFSARYMRLWYRDRVLKGVLAWLIGTFAFAFSLLRRVETGSTPSLGVTLAGFFTAIALVLFLLFLDRFVHRLRPVAVASLVARAGRSASRDESGPDVERPGRGLGPEHRVPSLVVATRQAGSLQALDRHGLVRWAAAHDSVVVVAHPVGDFVSAGTTVLEVYSDVPPPPEAPRVLRGMVALGVERTIEQDPAFALRVMVDIANLALSQAVNDPTTATQVLDHLGDTLLVLGRTPGLAGRATLVDASRQARLVVPEPRWEDYLSLGVTEIRIYGARSLQVVRRLRSMLESLRDSVLEEYVPAVEQELARLDATVETTYAGSPDLDLARRPDSQGIGGPAGIGASASSSWDDAQPVGSS